MKDLLRYGWRVSGGARGSGAERLEQTERAVRELAALLKRISAHRLMHLVVEAPEPVAALALPFRQVFRPVLNTALCTNIVLVMY